MSKFDSFIVWIKCQINYKTITFKTLSSFLFKLKLFLHGVVGL